MVRELRSELRIAAPAGYRFNRRYSLEICARNVVAETGREFISGGRVTRLDFYDTFHAPSFTAHFGGR